MSHTHVLRPASVYHIRPAPSLPCPQAGSSVPSSCTRSRDPPSRPPSLRKHERAGGRPPPPTVLRCSFHSVPKHAITHERGSRTAAALLRPQDGLFVMGYTPRSKACTQNLVAAATAAGFLIDEAATRAATACSDRPDPAPVFGCNTLGSVALVCRPAVAPVDAELNREAAAVVFPDLWRPPTPPSSGDEWCAPGMGFSCSDDDDDGEDSG